MIETIASISATVIFLLAGSPPVPIGTAFIVGYPSPYSETAVVPLIVTAKHVVLGRDHVIGRFNTKDGEQTTSVTYDLTRSRANNDYWEHPDDGVDIVVFRTQHFAVTDYLTIPLEALATKDVLATEEIIQTDRVMFPTLLVNFMGTERNYPVMRNGSVALIPKEPVPMKYELGSSIKSTSQEVILIDATSMPGASGAPVFLWPGPRSKGGALMAGAPALVLGVMHGFYKAAPRDLVEVETTDARQMFQENSGIAVVFPAWRLREILELPEVDQRISAVLNKNEEKTQSGATE